MNETTDPNIPTNLPSNVPAPAISKPGLTPGWQTSEFWMTALGHAGIIFAAVSGALPAKYAALASAAAQVAYNLSRGISKVNASH